MPNYDINKQISHGVSINLNINLDFNNQNMNHLNQLNPSQRVKEKTEIIESNHNQFNLNTNIMTESANDIKENLGNDQQIRQVEQNLNYRFNNELERLDSKAIFIENNVSQGSNSICHYLKNRNKSIKPSTNQLSTSNNL